MTEDEYFAQEFTDEFLHAQADAGDYHLEEHGYNCMPTHEEIRKIVAEGNEIINAEWLKSREFQANQGGGWL
jgi:hypothetical protein